ncbi:META domain-containing protein [Agromyces sp. MMS24-JH15]|uniref:META domain-containing protein n=1 Tax=Agromyces sp. MMS24-JH15 TaxID=3243765 RepID=UPI00374A71E2
MGGTRAVILGVGAVVAAIALSGCGGSSGGGIDVVGTWGDPTTGEPYLSLAEDGTLTGSDGCNRLAGGWELDEADQIEFGDVASTLMACEGVDTWLSGLDVATVSGTTMTILSDDGAEIGRLERTSDSPEAAPATTSASPSPSASSDDSASVSGTGFVGTWGTADPTQPHLVLGADGSLTGSDGCNTLMGTWELEDDGTAAEFNDVAMTRMACPDGDQTLGALDSGTVQGDTLTVVDDHGTVLATLPRTA